MLSVVECKNSVDYIWVISLGAEKKQLGFVMLYWNILNVSRGNFNPLTLFFFWYFVISCTCIRCFVPWLTSTPLVYAIVTSNHRIYYLIQKLLCWSYVILAGREMVVGIFLVYCLYFLKRSVMVMISCT